MLWEGRRYHTTDAWNEEGDGMHIPTLLKCHISAVEWLSSGAPGREAVMGGR